MRLTAFTDLGLRALMRMAGEPRRQFTTDEIADEFAISRNHLVKIVRALGVAGFVTTKRGVNGGIRLARDPRDISIGAVVRSLERKEALVECFREDGGNCRLTAACRLRHYLASARESFLASLDGTSLADCAYPSSNATARHSE